MDFHIPKASTFSNSSRDELSTHHQMNAFQDQYGRYVNLRGINVGACAKYPRKITLSGTPSFFDTDNINFVGRPFASISEAREWWQRLAKWGVNVIRFIVVWEALEPVSRGNYDEEYIDYVVHVLEEAEKSGLKVFIDCHQDVWSRFCGGSGAPLWTFHLAGLNPEHFRHTMAAALESPPGLASDACKYANPSARLWPTNYSKLACNTMFTLFFGGETWCPDTLTSEGVNVGTVLRAAYCNAYGFLAKRLAHINAIMGFDLMNEPHPGFIGLQSLDAFDQNTNLHLGAMPTALQGMALAGANSLKVPYYTRSWPGPSRHSHDVIGNPEMRSAWKEGCVDIWQCLGLYTFDKKTGKLSYGQKGSKDYFKHDPRSGREVNFEADYYEPFIRQFRTTLLRAQDGRLGWALIEPVPNLGPPNLSTHNTEADFQYTDEKLCYAPHWYDLRVLFEKALWYPINFNVSALAQGSRKFWKHSYFGSNGLTANYTAQFDIRVAQLSKFRSGSVCTPLIIGETGVPFDMNELEGYYSGNLHNQLTMLDAIISAMERHLMNWTLWTFTLVNDTYQEDGKIYAAGDWWNTEDFSLVSNDPATTEIPLQCASAGLCPHDNGKPFLRAMLFSDLYKGCRVPAAWIRPYAAKIAGIPNFVEFDMRRVIYSLTYKASNASYRTARTTEIFLPLYHYGKKEIHISVKVFVAVTGCHLSSDDFYLSSNEPTERTMADDTISLICYPDGQSVTITHSEKCFGCKVSLTIQAVCEARPPDSMRPSMVQAILGSFV